MLRSFLVAILLVTPFSAARSDGSSDGYWKLVYDVYIEEIKHRAIDLNQPRDLYDYQKRLNDIVQRSIAAGGTLKAFYKFKSPDVAVPPTNHPVHGDQPACGVGQDKLDAEVINYVALLGAAAGAADVAYGGGYSPRWRRLWRTKS